MRRNLRGFCVGFFSVLLGLGLFCGLWVVDTHTAARGFAESAPAFGVLGESPAQAKAYLLGREISLPVEGLNRVAQQAQHLAIATPPLWRLVGQGLTTLFFIADDYLTHALPFTAEQAVWEGWASP